MHLFAIEDGLSHQSKKSPDEDDLDMIDCNIKSPLKGIQSLV